MYYWRSEKHTAGGEDQEHQEHPCASDDQRRAPTSSLNQVDTNGRHAKVDTVQDHLSDEAVVDTGGLENNGSIVKKVVGSSELLKHLEKNPESNAVAHPWSEEHVVPFPDGTTLAGFGTQLSLDFLELHVDSVVIRRGTIDFLHRSLRLFSTSLAIGITRSLRESKNSKAKNGGEDPAKTD
jgi:hypothetical protein